MTYKYSYTVEFDERGDLFNNPNLCPATISSQRSFANGSGYLVRFPGTLGSYEASVAFRFRGDTYYCTWEDIWDHVSDYSASPRVPPHSIRGEYAQTWDSARYSWMRHEERSNVRIQAISYLQYSLGQDMLILGDDEDNSDNAESGSDHSSGSEFDGNDYFSDGDSNSHGNSNHYEYHYDEERDCIYYADEADNPYYVSDEDNNSDSSCSYEDDASNDNSDGGDYDDEDLDNTAEAGECDSVVSEDANLDLIATGLDGSY